MKLQYKVVMADQTCKYPTTLLHVLFQFPRPVQMYGAGHLNERLQQISLRIRFSSVMSLMPVDFRSDNLLALAVLASFDDKSSPQRDQLWREYCRGVVRPPQEVRATTSLPEPAPVRPSMPMMSPLPYQQDPKPAPMPMMSPQPYQQEEGEVVRTLVQRARSRTPAPRSRAVSPVKPRSSTPAPTELVRLPVAKGLLLTYVSDLWQTEVMRAIPPGTQRATDLFQSFLLYVPAWVSDVLDYDVEGSYTDERGQASTIFGSSVIRCLKILAKAMHACGRALYRASKAVAQILRDQVDAMGELAHQMKLAFECCTGIIPVVEAFRHMKAKPELSLDGIGAMPETYGEVFVPPASPLAMPAVFASATPFNQLKLIYRYMFNAANRMEEMHPETGVFICWDRIARKVGELQQILGLAHEECQILAKYCEPRA